MYMFKLMGLFAIVPATLLLTVSFFVLLSLRKTEPQGLKAFGYVITVLLCLSALLVLSVGFYKMSKGPCMMKEMKMRGMMGQEMPKTMPMKK
ncbi:MAG: hypothetical protein ABIH75_02440 [Candidatus Omnitrophota bacterium]